MARTLADDRLHADTHSQNTTADLNRQRSHLVSSLHSVTNHDVLAADSAQRSAARRFDNHHAISAYLDHDVDPALARRVPGWTASIADPVRGPDGLLPDPAVVIHRVDDATVRVAAIALSVPRPIRTAADERFTLPDPARIADLAQFGIAAHQARLSTAAAADTWELTVRVCDQLAAVTRHADPRTPGEELLEEWVRHTELDDFVHDAAVAVRYPPGGGTNLDYEEFANHQPYKAFAIWELGNAAVHIAHSGPDPRADGAEPVIVASIDNQAAEHPASARAVAQAAISTLRAQLDDRDNQRVPVLYDPTAALSGLRCTLCEPDVALIDAPMRPPRSASLGLVETANPQRPSQLDWAENLPARTRSRPSPALSR